MSIYLNPSRVFLMPNGRSSGTSPAPLPRAVDFNDIISSRNHFVSWVALGTPDLKSLDERNVRVDQYRKSCEFRGIPVNQETLADKYGGSVVRLRETILAGGLRYVGIYWPNGEKALDYLLHRGRVFNVSNDDTRDSLNVSDLTNNYALGDGFQLLHLQDDNKISFVKKEFRDEDKSIYLYYQITPEDDQTKGRLRFIYEQRSSRSRTSIKVHINDTDETEKLNEFFPRQSFIEINYNFELGDRIEFSFDEDGYLKKVSGFTVEKQTSSETVTTGLFEPAPEPPKKHHFEYLKSDPEARRLALQVFQQDITHLRHFTRDTIRRLVEAATQETEIEPYKILQFIP